MSLSSRTAGVIDCLLGQISHNSVGRGLNLGIILTTLPDSKSADISRQDLTAKPLPAVHQRLTKSPSFDACLPFILILYSIPLCEKAHVS